MLDKDMLVFEILFATELEGIVAIIQGHWERGYAAFA